MAPLGGFTFGHASAIVSQAAKVFFNMVTIGLALHAEWPNRRPG